jgi:DNA-binding winged helix-turn-helix (wHTH) protein
LGFQVADVAADVSRQVLSRDQLRRAVVGRRAGPDDRSIDVLVGRLRRKIEPNPKTPRFILSVAGVGYKFAVRPQVADHGNALTAIELLDPSGLGATEPNSCSTARPPQYPDPVEFSHDAFARLQQMMDDRVVAAIRVLTAELRKVLA